MNTCTVELQCFEHLWGHENIFETGVVRDSEFYFVAPDQEAN